MNFVEKFDGLLPNTDAYARGYVHVDSVSTHAPPGAIIVDDGQLLFTGDFKRTGLDLVIAKDDRELVLHDYFKGEKRAPLASPDGAHLTGDLVSALTGYTQYAQAGGAAEPAKVIGHVTKLTGNATAIRNGVAIVLNQGDNVNKGDVVQSGGDSTLGITFIDGTVFGLGPNAKMVLNEMIYDPNGSSNSSLMSLVSGTISFVAGATAKHGDMKVDTPVATMGIRGTAVLVEIDFDVQGTGGVPPAKFQVLVEPDGSTGSYILFDKTTLNPIATIDQAGTQTIVNGQGSVSFVSSAQLSTDAQKLISDVFALKFTDNNNPNTKLTTNFTDSVVPVSTSFKLTSSDSGAPIVILLTFVNTTGPQAGGAPNSRLDHIPGPPQVVTQDAVFTERPGLTQSGLFDTATGQIKWLDLNVGDIPSAKVDYSAFSYRDANGSDVTSSLTAAQLAAIKTVEIPLLLEPNPNNKNAGSATWTYNLADSAFDFLAAGETLTLTYVARVDNNFAPNNETTFKTFTITITGTNDTPAVTSSTQAGSITELAATTNSAQPDTAHGTLTFTDADLTDTHTVTITGVTEAGVTTGLAGHATVLSWLSLGALTDSTDGVTGSRSWTFSAADRSFDYLATGETLTLTYTIEIDDHQGGVVTLPVTITIVGTDDRPVITSPTQAAAITEAEETTGSVVPDTASGTVTFVDVDLSDTHRVTVAGVTETGVTTGLPDQATILGWMSLGTLTDSTGGVTGSRAWTFSAADGNFDYLAVGETLTLTYLIQVDDHHGGVVTQPVTITITGTNDAPSFTSEPPTATVPEMIGETGSIKLDVAQGAVTFADVDLSDTHIVSITAVAESGTTTGLPEDESTILNWLSLGTLTDSTGGVAGSQAWTFSAADRNFDYLADGETLTLTYTVEVNDHHGGVISQPVTITITGSNDAPIVTSAPQAAIIPEQPDTTGSSTPDSASGTVTFTDVDLSDTHTMTITGVAESGATTGLPDESTILNWLSLGTLTDATGGSTGSSTWTFSAADQNFDYLALGETLTLTYTIQIDDQHGGVVNEPVTITINGANDAPTLADVNAGTLTDTADNDTFGTLTGTLHGNDVDHGETATLTYAALNSDHAAVTQIAGLYGSLTINPDGTYSYVPDAAAINALGKGTYVDTFDVETIDAHGAVGTATLTIDVIGANDTPVIHTDNVSITEHPNGTETISGLTVTDADATADETFTMAAATTPGAGSSVAPSSQEGLLSSINTALGSSGLVYNPGQTPPATDKIALSVTDGHGATDTVNLIFNVQQDPPQPVTLTGTSDKDVFFGSGYQDKFVFAPSFNHDTILNFTPGQDQIDLSTVVSASTFSTWFDQHVATSPTNSADTLITVDGADTITLHNVAKASLSQNDFIIHFT
ncbi:VCBS repeat-containing protein [Bradyrhizobium japonicum]|uniref:VCBS repeat-containing protein n=1 Tax=Bradyrhizobium elkanii TaxID=29448 RepID=A0ABV4FDS6_BRAEL|nr:VCBS domain-containing protein [Bradyrhizobium elkanii]MBP2431253.1 VCBS repeat-containing protein [Bradyrhizobium elkanii]MCP1735402.1 VCBS repeat-containing protein [Bradyrhizobium elkanii]MCP1753202.1 VCBS repeat-containing protein [Bradyrhizobium elkanii]MCP1978721.1 VCBS repeat-containing protein [Bradyrhizobium elkanii]MCS3570743.1 VCBS repeat-containing protein [Bradyrhizobium elkanii]